jgi:hypothetical protein
MVEWRGQGEVPGSPRVVGYAPTITLQHPGPSMCSNGFSSSLPGPYRR